MIRFHVVYLFEDGVKLRSQVFASSKDDAISQALAFQRSYVSGGLLPPLRIVSFTVRKARV